MLIDKPTPDEQTLQLSLNNVNNEYRIRKLQIESNYETMYIHFIYVKKGNFEKIIVFLLLVHYQRFSIDIVCHGNSTGINYQEVRINHITS